MSTTRKPRDIVLELLQDGNGHDFQEIHEHIVSVTGETDRSEKSTRVVLQTLKETGHLGVSSVKYARLSEPQKANAGE